MKKIQFLMLALALVALPAAAQQIITTTDGPMAIDDNADALNQCQSITAASETITDLNVQIEIAHSWAGDLTVLLDGPASDLTMYNRPGGTGGGAGDSSNLLDPLNFSDHHPNDAETMGGALGGGDVICGTDGICEFFPNPDATSTPIGGVGTTLAQYNGTDAAGTWMLCVGDQAGGDTGTLISWTLGVNARVPVELESFSID